MIKVIHDTDIGSDIDDAVALAYLLANPECELLGVTTVTGNVEQRAQLASVLCKVAGRSIPIYPGAGEALLIPQKQPDVPQAKALERWEHDQHFPKGEAIEFLRQTIRKYPGEVTLLTTGPLTNAALLFKVDPEIPSLLRSLVMMCGTQANSAPFSRIIEWNAICDPHAAAIVYRSKVAVHRSIGLQVTLQVQMSTLEVRERFTAELLRPVLDFAEIWFEQQEKIIFHDPLAAATIFDDQICLFERGNVTVELETDHAQGRTNWTPDENGQQEVAMDVKPTRFFTHFFFSIQLVLRQEKMFGYRRRSLTRASLTPKRQLTVAF